jgi:hypothetical protein
MAKEKGFFPEPVTWGYAVVTPSYDTVVRFAQMIAEAEREAMIADGWRQCAKGQRTTQFCGQAEQARLKEREECAKVCDSFYESWIGIQGRYEFMGEGAEECASAIRARGDK